MDTLKRILEKIGSVNVFKLNKNSSELELVESHNKLSSRTETLEETQQLYSRNKDIVEKHLSEFVIENEGDSSFEVNDSVKLCLDEIAINEGCDDLTSDFTLKNGDYLIEKGIWETRDDMDGIGIFGWDYRNDIPPEWSLLKIKLKKIFSEKKQNAIEKGRIENKKSIKSHKKSIDENYKNDEKRQKNGYANRNELILNRKGDYAIGELAIKARANGNFFKEGDNQILDLDEEKGFLIYSADGNFKNKFSSYDEAVSNVDFKNEILVYLDDGEIEKLNYDVAFNSEWLKKYQELVDKFLEIAERKVSVIDDYGDEDKEELWDEILRCLTKIAKKEGDKMLVEKKDVVDPKDDDPFCFPRPHEEKYWLLARALKTSFLEHHKSQQLKPSDSFDIDSLSGVEFETWIVKILKENGFSNVSGTPATGDQGADVIAKKDGKKIIIQAKRYDQPVGNKAVQEVVGAIKFYGGNEGWVMTNASFTSSAKALANKCSVKLIDGHMLRDIEKYLK